MLNDYREKYYNKLYKRSAALLNNDLEDVHRLSDWKNKILKEWKNISVVSTDLYDSVNRSFPLGGEFVSKITADLGELSPDDVGMEIVFITQRSENNKLHQEMFKEEMTVAEVKDKQATFECKIPMDRSGVFEYGFRMYPKNPMLADKVDLPLVKWI